MLVTVDNCSDGLEPRHNRIAKKQARVPIESNKYSESECACGM